MISIHTYRFRHMGFVIDRPHFDHLHLQLRYCDDSY